ncbi:MAG TPA: superinfection immunity protein [Terricaulis sp.]|nr:superinfection immunity protein [Terricaulis sp.]HRP10198.1 superinfection immunity protein [Terricaulis sp.]
MVTLTILTALFFLPAIIAIARGHNALAIFLLNFFFGWTMIGWFWALIWAVTDKPRVEYVQLPAAR